ncbi:hypothetical protein DB313_04895 (plasmid) [Borrelia turcica IST7]|uniref:Uncharacterized protein n=1 Tax=Borrelia turcica IST7 TaxID=1104446 RepID=A0A386PP96_9SPIR|nr:hypothetical protein [Borrelia turcica]AYE36839.1 hypothetical protein DB313_04895 [Borrelia turcica IST7]
MKKLITITLVLLLSSCHFDKELSSLGGSGEDLQEKLLQTTTDLLNNKDVLKLADEALDIYKDYVAQNNDEAGKQPEVGKQEEPKQEEEAVVKQDEEQPKAEEVAVGQEEEVAKQDELDKQAEVAEEKAKAEATRKAEEEKQAELARQAKEAAEKAEAEATRKAKEAAAKQAERELIDEKLLFIKDSLLKGAQLSSSINRDNELVDSINTFFKKLNESQEKDLVNYEHITKMFNVYKNLNSIQNNEGLKNNLEMGYPTNLAARFYYIQYNDVDTQIQTITTFTKDFWDNTLFKHIQAAKINFKI